MSEETFTPFQRVLVRYDNDCTWSINFFERKCGEQYKCLTPGRWMQCIPYEGNEHLLGTTEDPTPPKPEFKWGDKVEVRNYDNEPWETAVFIRYRNSALQYQVMIMTKDEDVVHLHYIQSQ